MLDLARELRDYAEAADAITLDEAMARRPRRRRARVVVGIAAAIVLVTAIAVLAVTRDDGTRRTGRIETTTRPTLPASCLVPSGTVSMGCRMDPAEASRYVGFDVRVPTGMPTGWVLVRANLRVYPAGSLDQGGHMIAQTTSTYTLDWAPPGTDLDAAGTCPSLIFVRERLASPGESASGRRVDLGNGHSVTGTLNPDVVCRDPGGPHGSSAYLTWIDAGISFTLNSWNADPANVLEMVRSLAR